MSISTIEVEYNSNPLFGVLAHGYQPPRLHYASLRVNGQQHEASFSVAPWINTVITDQVYKPLFADVDFLPPGLITSMYASLRSDIKVRDSELFSQMQNTVKNTPDNAYALLGDPFVHVILPFFPPEDQRMLLRAGKKAYEDDFGFEPKGLWLPEMAISKDVVQSAAQEGYEFIPLLDNQVKNIPEGIQLDAEHNVCFVKTDDGKEIALVLANSSLSQFVSYAPWSTYDASGFMRGRQQIEQQNGWNSLIATDLERYGHHQVGADGFLKTSLNIQRDYGYTPINMRTILDKYLFDKEKTYVEVVDNSSWSCPHSLGRWTGNCDCDQPTQLVRETKQYFHKNLIAMNEYMNNRLDTEYPGWRDEFEEILVSLRDQIFTGHDFVPQLVALMHDDNTMEEKIKLYFAKIEILIGMTSCGWFFGDNERPEREIPQSMIQVVQQIFPNQFN